jgi:DNA-binding NarL/FixJ family response regulator
MGDDAFARELAAGSQSTLADARIDAIALARSSSVSQARPSPQPPTPAASGLTARELDVLKLIVEGKTDRQIAEALFITPKTANHHVTRILSKLECRNRAAATALAFQRGLV